MVLKPIRSIAEKMGIPGKYVEPYGYYKAKISLDILKGVKARSAKRRGKYIVVTGITPTHLGEGKTVTTLGLSMALNKLGKKAAACIRQPSAGPFFGIKGGGAGGGKAMALPADCNWNFYNPPVIENPDQVAVTDMTGFSVSGTHGNCLHLKFS